MRFCALFLGLLLLSRGSVANPSAYEMMKEQTAKSRSDSNLNGWAYIISGGITLGISIPGYYLTEDIFARTVFAIGETLGVGAVGYGAYSLLIHNEMERFQKVIDDVPSLTANQKEELAKLYIKESAERGRNGRKLRAISHSLVGSLNILNAFTASHQELRIALFFLGGVNALAAGFNLFGTSDEEELAHKLQIDAFLLPIPSVAVRF